MHCGVATESTTECPGRLKLLLLLLPLLLLLVLLVLVLAVVVVVAVVVLLLLRHWESKNWQNSFAGEGPR